MTEMPPRNVQAPLLKFTTGSHWVSVARASAKGNHVAGQGASPEEKASSACPGCGTEMVIVRVTPLLFGGEFEDLTLLCKTCGFTKMLKIRRR
jgi:hypothetical protein